MTFGKLRQSTSFYLVGLLLLSMIPLWWRLLEVGGAALGLHHISGVLLLAFVTASGLLPFRMAPFARQNAFILLPMACYLVTLAFPFVLHEDPYLGIVTVARQYLYFVLMLAVGVVFLTPMTRMARNVAIFIGIATPLFFIFLITLSLSAAGYSALNLFVKAVAQADPKIIIFQIMRTSMVQSSGNEELQANLRHDIIGVIFVSLLLAWSYLNTVPARQILIRWATLGGIALSSMLVVLSFSRSITLAFLIVGMTLFARNLLLGRGLFIVGTIAGAALLVMIAVLTPVTTMIYESFFENTTSYESRLGAMSQALADIARNPILGTDHADYEVRAHNILIDSWRGAGFLAALTSAVWGVALVNMWASVLAHALLPKRGWYLPIDPLPVTGLAALPIVRYLTTGGGGYSLTEYVSLGVILGLFAANRIEQRRYHRLRYAPPLMTGPGRAYAE